MLRDTEVNYFLQDTIENHLADFFSFPTGRGVKHLKKSRTLYSKNQKNQLENQKNQKSRTKIFSKIKSKIKKITNKNKKIRKIVKKIQKIERKNQKNHVRNFFSALPLERGHRCWAGGIFLHHT